jgi:phosphomevalonate kinase
MIDEMAANNFQTEEKAKLIIQNQKEKFQADIERLEKENNELKVSILLKNDRLYNKSNSDQRSNIKTISISLHRIRKSH